jgi:outer membrane protein assembly factor BamB
MRSSLAFVILASCALPAAAAPTWTLQTGSPIEFVEVTSPGNLLVGTREEVSGVEPLAGTIAWRRADLRALSRDNVVLIRGTRDALIVTREKDTSLLELLDLETGETRWGPDHIAIKGIRWQSLAPGGRLIVVGALAAGRSRVMAFDLAGGGILWQSDSLLVGQVEAVAGAGAWEFPKFLSRDRGARPVLPAVSAARLIAEGALPPVFDGDSAMTLFLTPDGPVQLDLRTGRRLWVSSVRAPYLPLVSSGFAPMLATDSLVLIPHMRSLRAVRRHDGSPAWENDVQFKSKVAQMKLTPRGLLVRGSPQPKTSSLGALGWAGTGRAFLALLDPETGETIWNRPLNGKGNVSAFVLHGDSIYVIAGARLSLVDLSDGSAREIPYGGNQPRQALIEEKPSPCGIEWRSAGIFLWTGTECWLVDPAEGLRYHARPEPAPGDQPVLGTGVIVFDLLMAVGWLAAGFVALSVGLTTGDSSLFDSIMSGAPPVIDPSIATHREPPRARPGAHHAYFATRMRDEHGKAGLGLLRVHKDTGHVDGEVRLGRVDVDSWFGLDSAAGRLFVRQGKQAISAYDL